MGNYSHMGFLLGVYMRLRVPSLTGHVWGIGVYCHGPYCIWGRRREPYLSSIGQQFSESVHSAEDDVVLDLM